MIKVKKIINSYFLENTYIVIFNNKTLIIDPGNDIDKIIQEIDNLDYILLTHGHMDHFASVKELQKRYNCEIFCSYKDLDFINGNIIIDPYFSKEKYNFIFKDYNDFNIEGIRIINTPGHSKGSVCIYFKDDNVLFSGDTLFKDGFGRYDFHGGNLKELKMSINKLFTLNNKTIVYPGHGEKTTINNEKISNIIKFY